MAWNYVPLERLVVGWSRQSGELPEVVLDQICNSDARGRFPLETFRYRGANGWCGPGQLRELVRRAHSSAYNYMRQEAAEALADVVVSKESVLAFCRRYDVRPPLCVTSSFRWFLAWRAQYAAPPCYPATPEEIVEEQERLDREAADNLKALENSANKSLNNLRKFLNDLRKIPEQQREDAWSHWSDSWGVEKQWTQADIERLPADETRQALEDEMSQLEAEFQSLAPTGRCQAAGEKWSPTRATAAAETKARRYLEEQVRTGNWQPKEVHFSLAKEGIGEGLSKRAFLRAWSDIAPEEWRKKGRPRSVR